MNGTNEKNEGWLDPVLVNYVVCKIRRHVYGKRYTEDYAESSQRRAVDGRGKKTAPPVPGGFEFTLFSRRTHRLLVGEDLVLGSHDFIKKALFK